MHIAKITTPGLIAMALAVTVLWSCFIGEQVLLRNAAQEQTRVLHEMRLLRQKQQSQPVSTPAPQRPGPARPVKS